MARPSRSTETERPIELDDVLPATHDVSAERFRTNLSAAGVTGASGAGVSANSVYAPEAASCSTSTNRGSSEQLGLAMACAGGGLDESIIKTNRPSGQVRIPRNVFAQGTREDGEL